MTSDTKRRFVSRSVRDLPRSGIRDFFEIVDTREDVISLSIGEPDFTTPWHIREASIFALDRGSTSYTANLGLLELREAIADYVRDSHGVAYDPATEILVTVGVSEALDLAVRAVVEPGDEVLHHEPCYVAYAPVVSLAGGNPVSAATRREDEFRLKRATLDALATKRTKAMLLNFPCNPTGAVLERDDIEGLAEFSVKHDLVVISDEVYSELTYEGDRISMPTLPGMRERTILLSGFSKAWAMTGYRIGFACAPAELIEAMMKVHQYTMMCASIVSQKAAIEALVHGRDDVADMREEYRRRRNFICASFNEMGLPCHVPRGAFYAFPHVEAFGLSSHDFSLRLLEEENVACVPGTAFGTAGEGFLRCSYATGMDEIKEAMRRLSRFVERLQPA